MKKEKKFILLCCLVYFTSYITRINYGAAIVEIVSFMGIKSSVAGIAVTCSFISYGVGQLISGFLGDRINPKLLVSIGLIITAIANIMVALVGSIYAIIVIWTINGFAQSLMWPPLVKIMTQSLSVEQYKKGCALVNISASVATIFIYLLVPVCIAAYNFKLIFIFSAIFAVITCFIWWINVKEVTVVENDSTIISKHSKIPITKIITSTGLIPILFVIVLQGMLRDGITTWMPTFINETFKLSTSSSILTTTIVPIFSIVAVTLTRIFNKRVRNEIALSTLIWGVAFISSIILLASLNSIIISIIAMSLITACMHGINLLLIGNLPVKFLKYGKVSFISGLLNSCTYIGSSLSAYGIARLTEIFGWNVTIIVWIFIILVGGLLCASVIEKYKTQLLI